MNLDLCFSSLGCPDFTMPQFCQLADSENIRKVEIRALDGTADYVLRMAEQSERLEECRQWTSRYGLQVRVLGSSFCLTSATSEQIPSLVREGRVADALQTPFIRIFGGGAATEIMGPELLRKAIDLYQEAVEKFREEGIRAQLMVEAHGGFTSSGLIVEFCQAAAGPVPILWDTHHTWKIGGEPLSHTFQMIGPWIRHIHVKDSVTLPDGNKAYRYVVPGEGEFPFAELFRILDQTPTDAALSLEWEKKWHPEIAPLEEALAGWKKILPR